MQISQVLQSIESILFTFILFLSGFIYSDAPIDINFDCIVTSGVYEYEAGETVSINVTAENIGRPFRYEDNKPENISFGEIYADGPYYIKIWIYRTVNEKKEYIYVPYESDVTMDEYHRMNIKKGYTDETTISFIIPQDASKGDYTIYATLFGKSEAFENAITIK